MAHAKSCDRGDVTVRRQSLFTESPLARLHRCLFGLVWMLMPGRVAQTVRGLRLYLRHLRHGSPRLPPSPVIGDSLAGIVTDLSASTLLEAYRRGLYTSGQVGPLLWTLPLDRCVLRFRDFHIGKDVRRLMRQARYRVTFDRAFDKVISCCARANRGRWRPTWITPRIMRAYAELHDAGYAHSYEVWNAKDELVGGGYGVAIGGIFFGESQFYRERNASKIANAVLIWHLNRWGFLLADAKTPASAMRQLGFRVIGRDEFSRLLRRAVAMPTRTERWQAEADTPIVAQWQPDREPVDREFEAVGAVARRPGPHLQDRSATMAGGMSRRIVRSLLWIGFLDIGMLAGI